MFIIWGWGGRPETLGSGRFVCPGCLHETDYDHKQMRTWINIFFIPIIPLGAGQRYVECRYCQGTFIEEVLQLAIPQGGGGGGGGGNVQIGELVLGKRGEFWYPGSVLAKLSKRFDVDFADGKRAILQKNEVFPLDLREGDPIFVRPEEGGEYQFGNITILDGRKLQVQFEDGRRAWTDLGHVRVIWEE